MALVHVNAKEATTVAMRTLAGLKGDEKEEILLRLWSNSGKSTRSIKLLITTVLVSTGQLSALQLLSIHLRGDIQ